MSNILVSAWLPGINCGNDDIIKENKDVGITLFGENESDQLTECLQEEKR